MRQPNIETEFDNLVYNVKAEDLLKLLKAEEKGFYYYNKNKEICFCRWCVRIDNSIIQTKPCYQVKETTINSCYYGDVENFKDTKQGHYFDWETSIHFSIKHYGTEWALTKEELEKCGKQ